MGNCCQSTAPKETQDDDDNEDLVEYGDYEPKISSGDLAILKYQKVLHFAIFARPDEDDSYFPLLLVKGKTGPVAKFDPKKPRDAHPVSASTRIFYGDYDEVYVRSLEPKGNFTCRDIMEIVDKIPKIEFSDAEIEVISKAKTPNERGSILCTLMVAHFYKEMGLLKADPATITPDNLQDHLSLGQPVHIKLPPVKEGPLANGEIPLFTKIVDKINPPPDATVVSLDSIKDDLNTGDIVLFSGVTTTGAFIKLFDGCLFSHCAIIIKSKYTSQVFVLEAASNTVGAVDVQSGTVTHGVQLLPLEYKVNSGWYSLVAIRRLTGIDDKKRQEIYQELFKFRNEIQGRPYEKNKFTLIAATIDFCEDYLTFLKNDKEDLSSIFCSELVAAAYQRLGLYDTKEASSEYTPDDFTSKKDSTNPLLYGKLEKEVYLDLKFD